MENKNKKIDKIWIELLALDPNSHDLIYILSVVERMKSGNQQNQQGVRKFELMELMKKVWAEFLVRGPTNEELRRVIGRVGSVRLLAGKKLLSQNPDNTDLVCIISHIDSLRPKARKLMKKTKQEIYERMQELVSSQE